MRTSAFTTFLLPFALGAFGCQQSGGRAEISTTKQALVENGDDHDDDRVEDHDDEWDDDDDERACARGRNPTANSDPTGVISTFSTTGPINRCPDVNPFFRKMGTNGRTCVSCHKQNQGFSISAARIQRIFNRTHGRDPLFRLVDGANRPDADVSTEDARAEAYSLLLSRGLIRVALPLPNNPEFTITAVEDPYGYTNVSGAVDGSGVYSFYRRPLPSTGLSFLIDPLHHVMWDGRETFIPADPTNPASAPGRRSVFDALKHQGLDATLGHAQADPSTLDQVEFQNTIGAALAGFQQSLFTGQKNSQGIGSVTAQGGLGGPEFLSTQVVVNQPQLPWNLYSSWETVKNKYRLAVFRGQQIFNNPITRVDPNAAAFRCINCHDATNVGNRVVGNQFPNINISDLDLRDATVTDPAQAPLVNTAEAKYLPTYTVVRQTDGATLHLTDLGRAMVTGKAADLGAFKVPALRGLAARAPYFHNGSRSTLTDVIKFYKARFGLVLTDDQIGDLAAFLGAL